MGMAELVLHLIIWVVIGGNFPDKFLDRGRGVIPILGLVEGVYVVPGVVIGVIPTSVEVPCSAAVT